MCLPYLGPQTLPYWSSVGCLKVPWYQFVFAQGPQSKCFVHSQSDVRVWSVEWNVRNLLYCTVSSPLFRSTFVSTAFKRLLKGKIRFILCEHHFGERPVTKPIQPRSLIFQQHQSHSYLDLDIALSDWGVSSWTTKHLCKTIQPVLLRAPEVMTGAPWGRAVDLWNFGCLVTDDLWAVHVQRQYWG